MRLIHSKDSLFIQHLLLLKYVVLNFDTRSKDEIRTVFSDSKRNEECTQDLSWHTDCSEQIFTQALWSKYACTAFVRVHMPVMPFDQIISHLNLGK